MLVFGNSIIQGWEARLLDVDMAYLEVDMEEKIYIELPETCQETGNQVYLLKKATNDLLKKATNDLIHAGLLWSNKFVVELDAEGFERSQADPFVFRPILCGKVVIIIVIYVDDLLMSSAAKRDKEQAL